MVGSVTALDASLEVDVGASLAVVEASVNVSLGEADVTLGSSDDVGDPGTPVEAPGGAAGNGKPEGRGGKGKLVGLPLKGKLDGNESALRGKPPLLRVTEGEGRGNGPGGKGEIWLLL